MYVCYNVCRVTVSVIVQEWRVDRIRSAYSVDQIGQVAAPIRMRVVVCANDVAAEWIATPTQLVEDTAEGPKVRLERVHPLRSE